MFALNICSGACLAVPLALAAAACQPAEQVEVSTRPDGLRRVARTRGGVLDGRTLLLYPSGSIAAIFYYRAGRLEGAQRWFYPNGNTKRIEWARNNRPNGRSYVFYPQGHPDFIDSLVNGRRQGRYVEFFNRPVQRVHLIGRFAQVNGQEQLVAYTEFDTACRVVSRRSKPRD